MPNTNSLIVYDGPSIIDGKPIVVILTGLDQSSENAKTGNLVQSFIIRSDIAPTDALKTGDDATTAYADADWSACHQPGNDIRRITLRIDGSTVKSKTY